MAVHTEVKILTLTAVVAIHMLALPRKPRAKSDFTFVDATQVYLLLVSVYFFMSITQSALPQ